MNDPLTQQISLDCDGRIGQDLACVCCGYNLRGLDPAGHCPECGAAISRSLQGDYLQFADPRWLARLHRGAIWIQWAAITPILVILAACVTEGLLVRLEANIFSAHTNYELANAVLQQIPVFAASIIGLIGCWKMTTAEPDRQDSTQSIRTSRTTRLIITSMFFAWLGSIAILVGVPRVQDLPLIIAIFASWPIGYLALLTHLRELALRMPDPELARDTHIAFVGAIVLNIFFGIWLFFLAGHYRKHLQEARQQAEVMHRTSYGL
jgi:uncharacterized protein (DUF486 family)